MSSEDVQYLKENLGIPLTLALAEITAVQPRDPIHYLGHWLFKYRYNQEISDIKKIELQQINDERETIAKQKWVSLQQIHPFPDLKPALFNLFWISTFQKVFIEEEAKTAVLECILRAEQESARKEILRIEKELEANEEESEIWNMGFKNKFDDF